MGAKKLINLMKSLGQIAIHFMCIRQITPPMTLLKNLAFTAGLRITINMRTYGSDWMNGDSFLEQIPTNIRSIKIVMTLVDVAMQINGQAVISDALTPLPFGNFSISIRE